MLRSVGVAPYASSDQVWIHDNTATYVGRSAISSIGLVPGGAYPM